MKDPIRIARGIRYRTCSSCRVEFTETRKHFHYRDGGKHQQFHSHCCACRNRSALARKNRTAIQAVAGEVCYHELEQRTQGWGWTANQG